VSDSASPHPPRSVGAAAPAVVGAALVLLYAPVLRTLAHVWLTDTYAAHGLLVAPYAAWVAFAERGRLRGVPRSPAGRGWVVLLLGLLILAAGWLAGSALLQALSVPVVVSGWVLLALGAEHLRVLAFPVGFLVFLAPLPRAVVGAVSLELQRFAAWFGAGVASLVGVPVYQEGVFIHLPALTLQIAEICNGLRFLTALLVLAVALGHSIGLGVRRLVALAASSLALAILANACRVAAIALGAHFYGPEAASGLIHHSIGKVVWGLTLLPLGLVAWWLRRGEADRIPGRTVHPS